MFRYMVGFALGASKWSQATEGTRRPHESVRAPLVVGFGAVFVFVAFGLAASSLASLRRGELTVDGERAKAYRNLAARRRQLENNADANKAKLKAIRGRMEALAPVQYFKVTTRHKQSGEAEEKVVALSVEEGLLSSGSSWTNFKRFLASETSTPAWSISSQALRRVLEKASVLPQT